MSCARILHKFWRILLLFGDIFLLFQTQPQFLAAISCFTNLKAILTDEKYSLIRSDVDAMVFFDEISTFFSHHYCWRIYIAGHPMRYSVW